MKKEIICDRCGLEISEQIEMHNRVIAQDEEGADVSETYFQCPACGKKYTILVTDRKLRLMIQKRVLYQKKIQRAKNRKDGTAMARNMRKHDRIKEEILDRKEMLMQKYADE